MAAKEHWYAIRCAPGYQRMARAIEGADINRVGETIIERNLRNEGVDVFMPAYWHEIRHHRSKRIMDRRLPLMVGYAFVNLPQQNFMHVRGVDGVVCFLRGAEYAPLSFRSRDMEEIAFEEHRLRQEIRREKIVRFEKETSNQIFKIRGNLRKILKKGRSNRINLKEQALLAINGMDKNAKAKILGMLNELDALEAYDGIALIDRVA